LEDTATLKRLLPAVVTEIFRNWDDEPDSKVRAVGFNFCNTSASSCKIYVSFCELSGFFNNGAIFSGLTIAANSSEYKEIPARYLAVDEAVYAYAQTADVVAVSIDFIGVLQELIPPVDAP